MEQVSDWLNNINAWYGDKHREYATLASLINKPPADLFSPPYSQDKSDALAYFFDGCSMLHRHEKALIHTDSAYSYLHYGYAKLQHLATQTDSDLDVRRWSIKRLERAIVTMMEFCQEQKSDEWLRESETLVELHISFMLAQSDVNMNRTTVL
ncbi:hypothetical protein [Enterovibrio coralii]|uniref:Transcriptional regulator n=1 Tax=Enterovibrio coralii TaxID=294935 RepID=A0A135I5G8_9GAMM|nr:hypothetical protein [Enterovibrio coralii]KXF80647.1 hypothetical protein ATN88_08345 [Enterovibrio coralii]